MGFCQKRTIEQSWRSRNDFDFVPYTDRQAGRFCVRRRVFKTRLSQPPSVSGVNRGNIEQRLENEFRCAILRQVFNGEEEDGAFLFVNMSSNRSSHAYQSREWKKKKDETGEETYSANV